MPPTLLMTDDQFDTLHASFKDDKGNATTAAGPVTWSVDDTTKLTLTPENGGLDCKIQALGPLGTAVVTAASVDHLGQPISATYDITIAAGGAASIELSADAPSV